ncbi:MAG TPA: PIN domain-containing protein [Anaerolineae bacterium]|nr:PIN domain-containing protein [Anaerolineae bacterium]
MPILYLDMNIYKRPFDDQNQMRIRLETVATTMIFSLVESGRLAARWSFVLDYENSRDPIPERREFVARVAQCCESCIEPDKEIRRLARHLADVHEIRGRDALHLACATASGCDCLVTCDARLIRQGQRLQEQAVLTLKVINPIDLLQEV